MDKNRFRKQILWSFIGVKILVAIVILFHYATGGYSLARTWTLLGVTAPLFSVFLNELILGEKIKDAEKVEKNERMLFYFLLSIYFLITVVLINLPTTRTTPFSFENFLGSIGGLDAFFGFYFKALLTKLFKEKKND